ncbi:MAG: hypothetical protein P9X24_09180 [Candidatus Hatepunaea meridiana]|nr:hypothetical protein [Candidatus Hatepunaea meridiana]
MPFWRKKRKPADGTLDGLIKVRGSTQLSGPTKSYIPQTKNIPKRGKRSWDPKGLYRQMNVAMGSDLPGGFGFQGANKGEFYRWLRDSIPIISTGVWTWVRLCATRQTRFIEGNPVEVRRAEELLAGLDGRLLEVPYGRGSGFNKLTEAYFLELFTTGRFAGEVILTENGDSIDHFRFIDPYRVSWTHEKEQGWVPYIENDDGESIRMDPARFFYGTLGTDLSNPFGVEPLASIPFVAEVVELMVEDMARSSHNAGVPRMQIRIGRPERFSWEGDKEYTERVNTYFRDTINEFQNLEPDQNVFTWNDVEISVVGGSGNNWSWRLNREQVIEDVITGLKLFPWVLGRTHKTTQNWVQSQFDLLMQMVTVYQKSGADLINWICNMELDLRGVKGKVTHRFEDHPNPFRLERMQADKLMIENVDFKVQQGYITKEEGIRLLVRRDSPVA